MPLSHGWSDDGIDDIVLAHIRLDRVKLALHQPGDERSLRTLILHCILLSTFHIPNYRNVKTKSPSRVP
jgi:hypothetical protein